MNILENIRQQFITHNSNRSKMIWSKSKQICQKHEHKVIIIDWQKIPLTIIHSIKAKRFRLSYSPGHEICLTLPLAMSNATALIFLKQHESRILKHHLTKSESIISSNSDLSDQSREHFLTYKQSALDFCTHKVEHRNKKLWWNYNNITVKYLKTKRWSCSSKWNLNFNYKLIFLPEPMADYIIVHELCHLQQMNHGPKFWKLVEEVYGPEWIKWKKIK